ncbi:MAG TPA: glycosyltransferase family 2 protein [Abditibacteriaceae bacterium]|jgi:undecaprenyl-phosphate 4-deoxy-4-formamido-L-arabinose transferase
MTFSISVVVPVYNSESTLNNLVDRLKPVLEAQATAYELILVNDGSRDESWGKICELTTEHHWIHGINLFRNYGQHNALLCGIRAAQHEIIVTLDDDLQHPPEEIEKLLALLHQGYDVVYGTAEVRQHGFWRNTASLITRLALQGAMGAKNARSVSSFRAFRTDVRQAFANYQGPHVFIDVLLTWGTTRFAAVGVRHDARRTGTSNYTFGNLVVQALNLMTGFSTLPLRIASLLGFLFTLFGIIILVVVVGLYLWQGSRVPGFPFLACIIAIFSGTQLFALGIIGEYLARMHFRMMDRPSYAVRQQRRNQE